MTIAGEDGDESIALNQDTVLPVTIADAVGVEFRYTGPLSLSLSLIQAHSLVLVLVPTVAVTVGVTRAGVGVAVNASVDDDACIGNY